MASRVSLLISGVRSAILHGKNIQNGRCIIPKRSFVCKESGAILPQPEKTSFGLAKVAATVIPFLYIGIMAGKEGAAFLEDNEIFVPDDDDD